MAVRFIQVYDSSKQVLENYPNAKGCGIDQNDGYKFKYNANGVTRGLVDDGGVAFAETLRVARLSLTGAALHAAVQAWANPEAVGIAIVRVHVVVRTVAGQAAVINAGTTAVSPATASNNLLDGVDVRTGAAPLALDQTDSVGGTQKTRQYLAPGKWVTVKEFSGDVTGLVAELYVHYVRAVA